MNVTLTIEDELVRRVRRIAAEQDKTMTGMIREYLNSVVAQHDGDRRGREMAELERSFREVRAHVGKRDWKRQDLYERS